MSRFLKRASHILEAEGPFGLMKRGLTFVACRLFFYRTYYLSEYELERARSWREEDFLPRLDDFTFRMVTSNEEADALEAEGLEFRSYPYDIDATKALDRGAIALCAFVGTELAAIGWVALTDRAAEALNEPPLNIDFSRDALTAPIWTNPKYRRLGLRRYRAYRLRKFLLERDVTMTRGAIPKGNIAALKGLSRIDSTVYGEARYVRLLWWEWWRERRLDAEDSVPWRE